MEENTKKDRQRAFGICLGASTVSFVKAKKDDKGNIEILKTKSITHNGDPKGILSSKIKK